MKSHFVSGYILKKFLSVFLIFSFFMAPLAPIFAQEAVLDNTAPASNVSGGIIKPLGQTTTQNAKQVESSFIQKFFDQTGKVPVGNSKSFKPKN